MMARIRAIITWLPALLCTPFLLAGCSSESGTAAAQDGPRAVPVTAIEAAPTSVPLEIQAIGQTEGLREVEVRARVGGILEKRLYREGEPVRAGQPLFEIDKTPYEIALAQARAELAQQQARLEQARREARRLQELLVQEAISRREHDDAASNEVLAQANLRAAEARLREAELKLSYTTVRAPVAGISDRALLSEGALVSGGDGLLTRIFQANPIRVSFSLTASEAAQVPGGQLTPQTIQRVELIRADGSVYPEPGKLDFTARQFDPRLGTLQLRAEFPNAEARLLPGEFVRVRLLVGARDGVYLIPQTAVLQSQQGLFVYVVDADGKAQVRHVQAGDWHGQDWIILGGLQAGDKVILDNLLKIRPGTPVAPQPTAAAAAPAGSDQT
jgi:membrane fusion protein (multidrug efflux system)